VNDRASRRPGTQGAPPDSYVVEAAGSAWQAGAWRSLRWPVGAERLTTEDYVPILRSLAIRLSSFLRAAMVLRLRFSLGFS
jgi:hypothetical protein